MRRMRFVCMALCAILVSTGCKIEQKAVASATNTITGPSAQAQCSDGVDNDEDGKIDMADPGCSGPNDNDETDPPEPPSSTVTGIELSPLNPTLTLVPGATCSVSKQFSANVQGTGNYSREVVWSSVGGNISSTGLFTATQPGSYTVKAESRQTPSVSQSTTVTVNGTCQQASTVSSVDVLPKGAVINLNSACTGQQQFTAVVAGTNNPSPAVTWTESGGSLTDISSSGVFSVNGSGSVGTYTITATSAQDTSKSSSTTVTVNAGSCGTTQPSIGSVTVAPKTLTCSVGSQASFGASVQASGGASTVVAWSVSNPSVASIATAASNTVVLNCLSAGTVTVTARSVADQSSRSDTGQLTVSSATSGVRTIEMNPAGGTVSGTTNATATCRIGGVITTSCTPRWSSSAPSRISVDPASGVIRRIAAGTAVVCVQWSVSELNPQACHTFTAP